MLWLDDQIIAFQPYVDRLRESGFNVVTASTVGEAAALLSQQAFDLLIVDWNLGDETGTSFIDRAEQLLRGVPIVILSSYLYNDSIREGFARRDRDIHLVEKTSMPQPSDDFASSSFVALLRDLTKKPRPKRSRSRSVNRSSLPPTLRLKMSDELGAELEATIDPGSPVSFVSYEWLLMNNLIRPRNIISTISITGQDIKAIAGNIPVIVDTEQGEIKASFLHYAVIDWRNKHFGVNHPLLNAVIGRDFIEHNGLTARLVGNRWVLSTQSPRPDRDGRWTPRSRRSKIATSLSANLTEISLSSRALLLLIDDRIRTLDEQRPNSLEAQERKDEQIQDYRSLRRLVIDFSESVVGFANGAISERSAVKATMSFEEGIRSWWAKKHEIICQRAFDMTLFLSSVAICSMAGAGGPMAVAVSGALVGGKTVIDAIKAVSRIKLPRGTSQGD